MKGRIIQSAKLYFQKEGSSDIRHIRDWWIYEAICKELGINTDYNQRTFLVDLPTENSPITDWPEKEPVYQVGPERMMFCVGPDMDFGRIADLGITVIQSYEASYHIERYLNEAERHGLKVLNSVVQLQQEIIDTGTWNRENMQAQIEACRGHPGFYGWHIFEELNISDKKVNHITQKQVYDFFKERDPDHPVTQTLSGFVKASNGGLDWDYVNFDALDFITPDLYPYDGTGHAWGMKPLVALKLGAKQEREYLDGKNITKPVMFTFQCCDEPAVGAGNYGSKVPLGHIEEQFRVIEKYGLFSGGVSLWAWDSGYFGPETSDEMYQEVKSLLDKIKEG